MAVAGFLLQQGDTQTPDTGRQVNIYQNGRLYATGHIGQKEEIEVVGEDGSVNVIAFTDSSVYMKSSTCHNQLCVEQGEVSYENYRNRFYGTQIICLPNRVTVELVLQEGERDTEAADF